MTSSTLFMNREGQDASLSPLGGARCAKARQADQIELAAIDRCRNGDIAGLEELYQLYSERVFRTCFRILGDRAAAEDQAQEVFLRVFKQIGRFQGRSRFSTWLYRLTVNHSLNRLKRRKRRLLKLAGMERLETLTSNGPTPERDVLRREQSDQVQRMLAVLSPDHRAVLVLREIEGLSYAEIAEVLGLSPGTVMSRLHRARRDLKTLFPVGNTRASQGVQRKGEDSSP